MSNSTTNTRSTEQHTAAPRKAALKVRTRVRAGMVEDDNTRQAQ